MQLSLRIVLRDKHQQADPPHPLGLLCPRRERPRRRTANCSDEVASLHEPLRSSGKKPTTSSGATTSFCTTAKWVCEWPVGVKSDGLAPFATFPLRSRKQTFERTSSCAASCHNRP